MSLIAGKLPACPPSAPRLSGLALARWLGTLLVASSAWRVHGELPDVPKLVMLAAPHSSIWDGVYGIGAACALGLSASWMGKDSLFRGPMGPLMRAFGGIPTDRSHPRGAVGQMIELFKHRERLWLVLAPEGTRKPVAKWRTGFWHIAHGAQVPLLCVYFHFPERVVGVGPLVHTSDDLDADLERLYAFYAPWRGRGGKSALPRALSATSDPSR